MTANIALGPGAEFDAIRGLVARWGSRAVGIGDDAALVSLPRGDKLVVSVDAAVEGRHFRPQWSTPEQIGYRAVVAALSDLAAMAARPLGMLIAMTLPPAWESRLDQLGDGIGRAADVGEAPIIGGNLSTGAALTITTTVLGAAFEPLARSNASAGDFVYVTGTLGAPGAALRALEAGRPVGEHAARLFDPRPRLREARWLSDRGARAAIDVSDGLVADLRHLAAASDVHIDIDGSRLPVANGVSLDDAIASGEEYELVVATPRRFDTVEFRNRFGIPLTEIGTVARFDAQGFAERVIVRGARVANVTGHDHFSR